MKITPTRGNIIRIDYSEPWEAQLQSGNFDNEWKNGNIITEERFPIVGEGINEYEFCYFQFIHRPVSSETVLGLIKKEDLENPWEPAKIEHLIAFSKQFSREPGRKYYLIALGSIGQSFNLNIVTQVFTSMHTCKLLFVTLDGLWDNENFYFLAVRKIIRPPVV